MVSRAIFAVRYPPYLLGISPPLQAKSEANRAAQIYRAAIVDTDAASADITRTIHYAKRSAKDIRVRDAPTWMVQNVIKAGEQLQSHALHHPDVLDNRSVPGKRVSIANE